MKALRIKQLAILVVTGLPGLTIASGFALTEQSASGLGNAFAGAAASAEDASTIFFNPAGMTRLPDRQVAGALHLILPSAKYSDGNPATNDGGDAGSLAAVPNFYYVMALSPATRFGLGVNAPFGLKTDYDLGWAGQFSALKSDLKTINLNPSLATKLTDQLSVGIGLNIDYAKAELSNFVPPLYGGASAGTATVKADDWGVGANAGLLYELDSNTRIGFSYRSRIKHKLEGDATFAGSPLANTPITADLTLPDIASLSIVKQISPALTLLGDVSYTAWSVFDKLTIVRSTGTTLTSTTENWDDTWRFSMGATYRLNDALKLRGGLAYDQSPVPDAYRTPRIPDNDRTWVALGMGYQASKKDVIDVGYAHLFSKDPSLAQNTSLAAPLPGSYKFHVDILSAQYTHTF
ncbi:MAG: outer membrane protein transport protein [Thiobacillaceae bacterium]